MFCFDGHYFFFLINLANHSTNSISVNRKFCVDQFLIDLNYQNGRNPKKEEEHDENDINNIAEISCKNIVIEINEKQFNDTWDKRYNIGMNFLFYNLIMFLLLVVVTIVDFKANNDRNK